MPLNNPFVSTVPTQQNWLAPTLLNGWANWIATSPTDGLNPIGYWKDSFGVVHLRGTIRSGTVNAQLFTLPTGYRPAAREVLMALSDEAVGRVGVLPNGQVFQELGTNTYLSLDGLTFRAV